VKIRRYYAHDCDSVNGFNNGRYIDSDLIEVKDIDEAFAKCREFIESQYGKDIDDRLVRELEDGYELTTGFFDEDGCDLTYEEYIKRDNDKDSYMYIVVNFFDEELDHNNR